MKEATGELNMTVVTVVAIAAVAAFFYAFVWPAIKKNIQSNTVCSNGPGTISGTAGSDGYVSCADADTNNKYTCEYTTGTTTSTVTCTVK